MLARDWGCTIVHCVERGVDGARAGAEGGESFINCRRELLLSTGGGIWNTWRCLAAPRLALYPAPQALPKQLVTAKALGMLSKALTAATYCMLATATSRARSQALLKQLDAERAAKTALERELRLLQEAGKKAEQAAAAEAADKVCGGWMARLRALAGWRQSAAVLPACSLPACLLSCMLCASKAQTLCLCKIPRPTGPVPLHAPACCRLPLRWQRSAPPRPPWRRPGRARRLFAWISRPPTLRWRHRKRRHLQLLPRLQRSGRDGRRQRPGQPLWRRGWRRCAG